MSSKRWPSGQPLTIAVTDMATGKAEARECPDGKSSGADCVGPTLRRLGSARRGRVGRCQGLFRSALAGEESPEALEGLSWAAWWLDDATPCGSSTARCRPERTRPG